MSWEVRPHPEVERWYLALCREDSVTADGVADAIDQLTLEGPNARLPLADTHYAEHLDALKEEDRP